MIDEIPKNNQLDNLRSHCKVSNISFKLYYCQFIKDLWRNCLLIQSLDLLHHSIHGMKRSRIPWRTVERNLGLRHNVRHRILFLCHSLWKDITAEASQLTRDIMQRSMQPANALIRATGNNLHQKCRGCWEKDARTEPRSKLE